MIENDALIDILLKHAPEPKSVPTSIKGFRIARRDVPNIIERCIMTPIVLITV